jgi:hypothetical protein
MASDPRRGNLYGHRHEKLKYRTETVVIRMSRGRAVFQVVSEIEHLSLLFTLFYCRQKSNSY